MIDMENWKPVVGYESRYEVSDKGRVKSLAKRTGNYFRDASVILKPNNLKSGYKQVCLYDENGGKTFPYIHRLVALAFIENPESKPEVNHKNGNKGDNSVENLEWVNASENQKHAYKHLGKKAHGHPIGWVSVRRKLTDEQVESIRKDTRSQSAIAKDYGVCQRTISNIKTGKLYKTKSA